MAGTITREQQQSFRIRVAAGVALILVGIALFVVLRDLPGAASLSSDDKLSSVPVQVHYPAPELSLYNINGTRQSLTDYRRKILLVNNWATWCPPCKAEMPTLEAYYEAHAAQGLAIVAIEAGEAQKDVQPFVDLYGLTFDVWLDPQNAAMAVFRNPNLPSSYVLDRTGIVRYAWTGEISRAMLERYITPLLNEQ